MNRPFIVFVFGRERDAGSKRYDGFASQLQRTAGFPDVDVITVALENLIFEITSQGIARVTDSVSGVSLANASYVYMKSWAKMYEEAAALSNFLYYSNVPCSDTMARGMGVSKLASAFRLWGHGLPVPATVYARKSGNLALYLAKASDLGNPIIVKDIDGQKGQLNFLLDKADVAQTVAKYPETSFICQEFIPNDGDYRVGVYFEEPSFVIKRRGSGNGHLNNTSAGGTAELIELKDAPKGLLSMAASAAAAVELQVAGVDIIVDKRSKKPYILEVNQGSQIVSGAFVDVNCLAFNAALSKQLKKKSSSDGNTPPAVIGRRARISIAEFGVAEAVCKIDTGAYSSSIHAENIRLVKKDGVQELVFEVKPSDGLATINNTPHEVRSSSFKLRKVTSSNGHQEERYSVETAAVLNGKPMTLTFTLTDRAAMSHPILIGRTALHKKYLVNVDLGETKGASLHDTINL